MKTWITALGALLVLLAVITFAIWLLHGRDSETNNVPTKSTESLMASSTTQAIRHKTHSTDKFRATSSQRSTLPLDSAKYALSVDFGEFPHKDFFVKLTEHAPKGARLIILGQEKSIDDRVVLVKVSTVNVENNCVILAVGITPEVDCVTPGEADKYFEVTMERQH